MTRYWITVTGPTGTAQFQGDETDLARAMLSLMYTNATVSAEPLS